MTEQNNNPGQSPYGGYGSPQQPSTPPQSPYSVPPQQAQGQAPYGAPQGQTPPPFQSPYQNNQPSGHFPAAQKPLVLETAYAFLTFLWMFGGHKFYMRQTMQGVAYVGAWVAIGILGSIVGLFGFLGWVALAVCAYGDVRTLKEQVDRSNNGEVFPIQSQIDFVKKAFNRV